MDIYYSGYIQTHCQKNKKIKRADQILPEVYGTILNTLIMGHIIRQVWRYQTGYCACDEFIYCFLFNRSFPWDDLDGCCACAPPLKVAMNMQYKI